MTDNEKILIIQTAFIGDVILATSLVESLANAGYQNIDILVRKGNQSLLENNPHINKVLIWDKKSDKFKNLFSLLKDIRSKKYNYIINLQRFGSTGFLTAFSKAKIKTGFKKNPFSIFFTNRYEHNISTGKTQHEIKRNHLLISDIKNIADNPLLPKLFPSEEDFNKINKFVQEPYVIIAPGSVWFTKQFPIKNWIQLIKELTKDLKVILIGGTEDKDLSEKIIFESGAENCLNLCGQISFLQSAALMTKAERCFVNDSAPLHIASAMNAKTTAIFCSTVPEFGFGPLSKDAIIIQSKEPLNCRPCGLHGKRECPEKHFDCGNKINITEIVESIEKFS